MVKKVKRVGALYGGREPGRIEKNLRVPDVPDRKVWCVEGRKGAKNERDVLRGDPEGKTRKTEKPKGANAPAPA
jgi:hypothetical protein